MIDVESVLRAELRQLVRVEATADWDEIVARSGLERERRRRRRLLVAVAVLAAALTIGLATPLGAAIGRSLDDFSAWLSGQPGSAVSEEEQREFDEANARSWLGFPRGTELRRLITQDGGGLEVELLGFRTASALCLRLNVRGEEQTPTLECAPLEDLRREGGPVRVVIADYGVGRGDKEAWYGIDRVHSRKLQLTAGIVADGVESVVVDDERGRHKVPVTANAFLYIAAEPEVGQRVRRIWARTAAGLVAVPFAPTPFGFGGGPATTAAAPAPPVERELSGGRIGWLERREARGEPLDVLPERTRRTVSGPNVVFGRVLAPDPARPLRIVLTMNAHRPGGEVAGLCTWRFARGGSSGGCMPYPETFERTVIPSGLSGGGAGAFVSVDGVASDDVARIEALLADGQRANVPLLDNVFLVDLPRAKLPARLVAYDAQDRVLEVSRPWRDFGRGAGPARGRAESLLRVSGPGGSHSELFVGPSDQGGECLYVKSYVDEHHGGVSTSCRGSAWTGPPLQLGTNFGRFLDGRVRDDVETVRLRFADGATETLRPTRGYVLYALPEDRLREARALVAAEGLSAGGRVIGEMSFKPPNG
jgi:hypothetical protein